MLKTLLKKQMAEIFRNYFYDPKKNKMRSRGATIAYIALYVPVSYTHLTLPTNREV